MRAAVLQQVGDTKLVVRDDVRIVDPGPGEVRVRVSAAGICHSDLSAMNGTLPQPVPAVLGHEGAGEVVEVGPGVSDLRPGDQVIICWVPPCGRCRACIRGQPNLCLVFAAKASAEPKFLVDGSPAFGMVGTGTFAEELVVPQQGAVKVDDDVPAEVAALVGCGVMTGVGAVVNTALLEAGSSVVVYGAGGVGISVIQGARAAGAAEILAVDPVERKLSWAREFGATHTATPEEFSEVSRALTGGEGFDYAFEAVGRSETIRAAYDATRRGGMTVIVGAGSVRDMVQFSAFELFFTERTIKGTLYGSANVRRDYARVLRMWRAGRLDLEGMITRRISLEEVNSGFDALSGGAVIRQIVQFARSDLTKAMG
ncbi:MAG: Zn-dependent alcohol dehydrogenase [Streptomycetales bacterium]